jgi:aryl-alcohol dehydrogenase-like predicted oxidoreductase
MPDMRYATLGHTGVKVSRFCLGAMMFGKGFNADHDDCVRIIHAALDAGINFIDTADGYTWGESEQIVGQALRRRRQDVVLATKYYFPRPLREGPPDPNRQGGSRRWILQSIEESLRRLQTDHVDLYQQHRFDADTAPEESLSALSDLVHNGKIRYLGSSSWPVERIVEAQWAAQRRGLEQFRCEQAPYSLFRRGIERAVLPTCRRYGMGVITYGPLDGGWLTGRYRQATDFTADTRVVRMGARWGGFDAADAVNRRKLELVAELAKLADEAGLPMAHLATAWAMEHPDVTSVIIGPRTMPQFLDSLAAAEIRLDTDLLDRIDELVAPSSDVNPIDQTARPAELDASYRRRRP